VLGSIGTLKKYQYFQAQSIGQHLQVSEQNKQRTQCWVVKCKQTAE